MTSVSFPAADLPTVFIDLPSPTQIALIRLATEFYSSLQSDLRTTWEASLTADEATKAEQLREEGRKLGAAEMVAQFSDRLGAAETSAVRIATLEAANKQLQEAAEAEAAKRAEAIVSAARQEFQAAKAIEFADMKARIAAAEAKEDMLTLLKEGQAAMRSNIQTLETELAKFRTTKSSHALGKIGEVELFEMLNAYVLPCFPYAEVRDMTAVKHVADFHLWINGPTKRRTKILVDSKKYSSPVQTCEIEKLYSDVDADEEADAGLMVSLDSAIYTKLQFQITKTKKGKPCMFMSFEKLDDGVRQEVLCWAVRVLVEVVAIQNKDAQDVMIDDLNLFLTEMDASVSDMENCMKMCRSLHDTLRDAKERLMMRINTYRVRCGMSVAPVVDVITHVVEPATRCGALNASGEQCKSRRAAKGDLCARHVAMETAGKIVTRV